MAIDPPPSAPPPPADPLVPAVDPAAPIAPPDAHASPARHFRRFPAQIVLVIFAAIAFLYFARPVALPVVLAGMAGMTLKPLIDWLTVCHLPKAVSALLVLGLVVTVVGVIFFQLGRPASTWLNDAPQHMTDLRQRVQQLFPRVVNLNEAAAAVTDLGATPAEKEAEQQKSPTVEVKVKDTRGTDSILNWTGTLIMGLGETLVLLFLLLASGDLFTQKFVHVMPTLGDKKRAVEISREIQLSISHYLMTVTLINLGLGLCVGVGLYFLDVPNAAMWGLVAIFLNYIPYFGPIAGVVILGAVGLLAFDGVSRQLLPPAWYLLLHLVEANFVTPVLLGRRLSLNPVVIFISLMFWTWLWGVPGALLSVPILVSLKVVCDHLPRLSSISALLEE